MQKWGVYFLTYPKHGKKIYFSPELPLCRNQIEIYGISVNAAWIEIFFWCTDRALRYKIWLVAGSFPECWRNSQRVFETGLEVELWHWLLTVFPPMPAVCCLNTVWMRPRSCGGLLTRFKVVWDGSAPLITPVNLPHLSPPPSGMALQLQPLPFPPENAVKRTHISEIFEIREFAKMAMKECIPFVPSQLQKIPFFHVWRTGVNSEVRTCVNVCCLHPNML